MCGIAGYYTINGKEPSCSAKQLERLLLALQSRGKDATGIYWETEEQGNILKLPIEASRFIKLVNWPEVRASSVCLLHCRLATQGSPKHPFNNHPLQRGNNIVIHNGIIWNSDKFVSNSKTDSLAILEAYKRYENPKLSIAVNLKISLSKLQGYAAIAFYNIAERRLFLIKASEPLCVGYKANTVFFASTKEILENVKPYIVYELPEDYMIGFHYKRSKGYNIDIQSFCQPKTFYSSNYKKGKWYLPNEYTEYLSY